MNEITREYLVKIGFRIDDAKKYKTALSFAWNRTHEGIGYWSTADRDDPIECRAKIDEMIRVWDSDLPKPVLVIPAGWKLVPITPDDKMKDAVREAGGPQALAYALASWQTMLANAPQPPEAGA